MPLRPEITRRRSGPRGIAHRAQSDRTRYGGGEEVEIELEEHEGVTTMRFTHRDLCDAEAVRSHEEGWGTAFDNLVRVL